MYEVTVGRDSDDRKKFGKEGMFLLGKHYVTMGRTTSLSNEVLMDVSSSHVVFVTGKRGSGKSFTMGAIAEGMMSLPYEIKSRLSVVMFDTMGIYWTMKYENRRDSELLREWDLKYHDLEPKIFFPKGKFEDAKLRGLPVDYAFSIKPADLSVDDWCSVFNLELTSPVGSLIGRMVSGMTEKNYSVKDMIAFVHSDEKTDYHVKAAAENLLATADSWGVFSKDGTNFSDIISPGQISVIDVSSYISSSGSVRALVIGLLCNQIFSQRLKARQDEEFAAVRSLSFEESDEARPLIWIMVDEAHEFLPKEGKTPASDALVRLLREGRQPGISLVLASQQPGKIHTDVMTQSDIVIAHHITAKIDTDALSALMQSYMRESLPQVLEELPDLKGAAIVFDDTNERIYPIQIRPRITWHGGSSPTILNEESKVLNF